MKKYDYIFFDLDGTLTDSQKGITRCAKLGLEALGVTENDYSNLLRFIGPPLKVSYREYYGFNEEQTQKAIDVFHSRYNTEGVFENHPYDGVPEMLQSLLDGGKKVYVATSKPEEMAMLVLTHFDLLHYFTAVMADKPGLGTKANVIRALIRQEGLEEQKDRILMVGDRHHDVDGAKEVGIDCLGVQYGFAPEGELEAAGAIDVVPTPASVAEWILDF